MFTTGKKLFYNQSGHTMAELIIAIVVTGIVSTIVLGAFLTMQKQYKVNQKNANKVFQRINIKNRLENDFKKIHTIEEIYSKKIVFQNNNSIKGNIISFSHGQIKANNKVILTDISDFQIELKETEGIKNLLFYSFVSKKYGWVGGSVEVFYKL